MKIKKGLALILALAMIITLMPTMAFATTTNATSVSYTHLDVYKRQLLQTASAAVLFFCPAGAGKKQQGSDCKFAPLPLHLFWFCFVFVLLLIFVGEIFMKRILASGFFKFLCFPLLHLYNSFLM